jgi:hypothetical protein
MSRFSPRYLLTRQAISVALVLGLVVPAAALARDSQSKQGTPTGASPTGASPTGAVTPVRYSSKSLSRAERSESSEPGAILTHILKRYGGSAVLKASFGGPLPGWRGTENPSVSIPPELRDGRWLYTTVKVASPYGPDVANPVWEADLVAGALRDELHLAGVHGDLIASNVSVRLPNGKVLENEGGGLGNVAFAQSFSALDDHTIEAGIRAAAQRLNLEVEAVSVLHPLQPAPAVVVRTLEPARFVSNVGLILNQLFEPATRYEGAYLEARDAAGKPVFIQASAFRVGVGQRWIRRDLDLRRQARAN